MACALNLSPSCMLGVLEWNPPGSQNRHWWALLLGVRDATDAACETPLGWLRRGRQLVIAQGALPLGHTGTPLTCSPKLMLFPPIFFALPI